MKQIARVCSWLAWIWLMFIANELQLTADTITGVFSNPVLSGIVLNSPTVGQASFQDNTTTAIFGTATPPGSLCAGSNMLCWGSGADLGIPASQQYSQLVFTGSTTFNSSSSAAQTVGTISYLNGTSDLTSVIFGATLSFFDNGVYVASDDVIISTTTNQFTGTGLTQAQLQTDADYINICGNDSNICTASIESYEDSEGGTGLLVDLKGTLVNDPTLILTGAALDPSQANCTTCGVVGTEAAAPEPSTFGYLSIGLILALSIKYFCPRN